MNTITTQIREALNYFYNKDFLKSKILYEQIIKNITFDFPELFLGYANVLYELNNIDLAIENYTYAIKSKNSLYEAYYGLALCYESLNKLNQAIVNYKHAINLKNDYLESYIKLANLFEKVNQYNDAKQIYKQGLQFCDNNMLLYDGLATLEYNNFNYNKALKYHKKALACINQNYTNESIFIVMNYSLTLFKQNKIKQAFKIQKKILKQVQSVQLLINLATMYQMIVKPNISIKYFKKVLQLEPNNYNALFGLSISYFYKQQYEKAFFYYEYRWQRGDLKKSQRIFTQPLYNGTNIKNKKLFIYCEQGYGDNIMFARFLPYLKKLSQAYIIFETTKPLHKLFQYIKGYDQLVLINDSNITFDYYLPIMSLPYVLKITEKHLYVKTPYIFLEKKYKFNFNTNKLKIGLSFTSSKTSESTYLREVPLKYFKTLFDLDNIQLYSLEVDRTAKDKVDKYSKIINLGNKLNNFYDTAQAIKELDLIISVDTSIVHLSAALNKPTYVLLSKSYDWRWSCKNKKSIWYPKVHIIKQKKLGKWKYVIKQLRKILTQK